jgi:methylated-DNA-[protein]-cysteine S-methyltransferase|tara:strand:- start:279 stop:824 length:546 start_codon:yes stop_codon:yes gene_type:complete
MSLKSSVFSKDETLNYSFIDSPLGLIGVACSLKGLVQLKIGLEDPNLFLEYIETQFPGKWEEKAYAFKDIKVQLKLYFKGKLIKFEFKPDPRVGTQFQKKVWAGLRKVPFGQTRSYAWLAKTIGNPKACRAVGNANGKNPISILTPCHRVIRESGALGGYTGGISYKQFLLDLEQKSNGTV